jgi:hypothetical protein
MDRSEEVRSGEAGSPALPHLWIWVICVRPRCLYRYAVRKWELMGTDQYRFTKQVKIYRTLEEARASLPAHVRKTGRALPPREPNLMESYL